MTRPCPAPGCDKIIPDGPNLCCLRHWRMIPKGLRTKYQRHAHGLLDGTSDAANLTVQMDKIRRVWAGQ